MSTLHTQEVSRGERFEFGANWRQFLTTLNDERIKNAERSLCRMLGTADLCGKKFLDIGSGSGLFSLAAKRLGAEVHSFDYDSESVACTRELKSRFFAADPAWSVDEGSALDEAYLASLGKFDVVYSWGVLHHTGNMQQALRNAILPVADNGQLFVAIYNDQGVTSKIWKIVKKVYCTGRPGRILISFLFIPFFAARSIAVGIIKHRNPLKKFSTYKSERGMSIYHDWIDWLGGHPFEVAKPEEIFQFYKHHGFDLENLVTTNRFGCNQFVFRRNAG